MAIPRIYEVIGSHADVDGVDQVTPEETTLQLPGDGKKRMWLITSFHYVRTAGDATSYVPRIGRTASFTNADIDTVLAYNSTLVGTPISEVFPAGIPIKADANGRVYFQPGFDTGLNNDGNYRIMFE